MAESEPTFTREADFDTFFKGCLFAYYAVEVELGNLTMEQASGFFEHDIAEMTSGTD